MHNLAGVEIALPILEAPPEALHKHVIPPTAATIHTDLNTLVFQYAGEPAALIGVEDLRTAILRDRLPHRIKQKSVASALETRQVTTRRLAQSRIASR